MLKNAAATTVRWTSLPILCSIAVIAFALTACANTAGSPQSTGDGDTSPSSLPTGGLRSQKPSPPTSIAQSITGRLGFDDIEGGCAYLETSDGTKHQVIYPAGWELQRSPTELISPDGETVARLGDTITVSGMPAEDMASTCQIGPMFRASEVLIP